MTDVWTKRAQAYRDSEAHREGGDLDLLVEWARGTRTALDVAAGGGHVARRLREEGLQVVTCDASPGMRPDVVCRADDLPFADGSFDVVACRVAAHHFPDVAAAVAEMARVARELVLVADNLRGGDRLEEAERLRDPTHVRCLTEDEWRGLFADGELELDGVQLLQHSVALEPWLERTGCVGDDAERVRQLVADRTVDGRLVLDRIVLRGRKR